MDILLGSLDILLSLLASTLPPFSFGQNAHDADHHRYTSNHQYWLKPSALVASSGLVTRGLPYPALFLVCLVGLGPQPYHPFPRCPPCPADPSPYSPSPTLKAYEHILHIAVVHVLKNKLTSFDRHTSTMRAVLCASQLLPFTRVEARRVATVQVENPSGWRRSAFRW